MTLTLAERMDHYTMDYMFGPENDYSNSERGNFWKRQLKGGMVSALGYALGHKDYDVVNKAYLHSSTEFTYQDQIDVLLIDASRDFERVVDMGCGRGELPYAIATMGKQVMGVDPMPDFQDAYAKTIRLWDDGKNGVNLSYLKSDFIGAVDTIHEFEPDTFILCETIEHIPEEEFKSVWEDYVTVFRENETLFIITNWIHYHPLETNSNWEHIWRIDDGVYDWLSSYAKEVVYRRGSHLVLQF